MVMELKEPLRNPESSRRGTSPHKESQAFYSAHFPLISARYSCDTDVLSASYPGDTRGDTQAAFVHMGQDVIPL